jgi:4-amino-4-deoxy-L-arabinose transferase-like glycosyltransferase
MVEAGVPRGSALQRHLPAAALVLIVSFAAWLRLWGIERNGFGTEYYAAGVLSMMRSLHNFFFVAFDPAGFLSLDKPPVAFWIQVFSAELLGFSGPSLILPQIIEGLAAILILYWLVRRRFGEAAGLLAAGALAIMPVSAAVDRSNNTDSCLVLVLLLAAAAAIRAVERQSFGWLLISMAILGIGFNVKMAAAFGLLPVCGIAYLLLRPGRWWPRVLQVGLAGILALVIGFSWFVAFDLVAPEARPYAGSTTHNSMLQMVFVEYGVDRFVHPIWRANHRPAMQASMNDDAAAAGIGFAGDRVPIGPLRLADPRLGGQIGWFMPLAALGAFTMLRRQRQKDSSGTPDLIIWVAWTLVYAVVFSFAGGIFHAYYLVALAPPIAALTGAGIAALWLENRDSGPLAWLLPAAIAATGLWQAWLEHASLGSTHDWRADLFAVMLAGTAIGTIGLIIPRLGVRRLAFGIGLFALSATPIAWALSTTLGRGNVAFPAADIAFLAPDAEGAAPVVRHSRNEGISDPQLLEFLEQNEGEAEYLLATQTATQAAPIILKSGKPVMAVGGYSGNDPILSPETLEAMVDAGQVRFFLLRENGRESTRTLGEARVIADWVKTHGQVVDPAPWRTAQGRQYELYYLRPKGGPERRSDRAVL